MCQLEWLGKVRGHNSGQRIEVCVLFVCCWTEEEWKRYYESLGGDNYKAMGFNYNYDGTAAHGIPPGYGRKSFFFLMFCIFWIS